MKLAANQSNSVVDTFEHCRQVRIVVAGPVMECVAGVPVILAEVTAGPRAVPRSMLFAVLFYEVRPAIQDGVWCIVAQIQKEWTIAISLDEFDRLEI